MSATAPDTAGDAAPDAAQDGAPDVARADASDASPDAAPDPAPDAAHDNPLAAKAGPAAARAPAGAPHPDDTTLIDRFVDALWLEDGLAALSLEAYRCDLVLLAAWLRARGARALADAAESDLRGYIAARHAGTRSTTANRRLTVFRRFYRLERSRNSEGSGLGLSLVAAVARLHGGRVELHDAEPGLRVTLRLPVGE